MSMSNYDLYRGWGGGFGEGIRTGESEPVINHLIAPLQESLNANNLTFLPLSPLPANPLSLLLLLMLMLLLLLVVFFACVDS